MAWQSDWRKRTLECEDVTAARNKRDRLIRRKLAGYIEVDEHEAVAALRNVDARLKFHTNGRLRQTDLMNNPFSYALIPFSNLATTLGHLKVRLMTFNDADLMTASAISRISSAR